MSDIDTALTELATMFAADGYRLESRSTSGRLEMDIIATDAACADCLVPKNVMETIVLNVLAQHGASVSASELVLRYPSDLR